MSNQTKDGEGANIRSADQETANQRRVGKTMIQRLKNGTDQAWPDAVRYGIGLGGVNEILWRCEALRGGRVYNTNLFPTRAQAQAFAAKLQEAAPDHTIHVEAVKASAVWN